MCPEYTFVLLGFHQSLIGTPAPVGVNLTGRGVLVSGFGSELHPGWPAGPGSSPTGCQCPQLDGSFRCSASSRAGLAAGRGLFRRGKSINKHVFRHLVA